jgi:hypothetical protein
MAPQRKTMPARLSFHVATVRTERMASQDIGGHPDELKRQRIRLARLEADLAYFQARLEIIGDPDSTNKVAQRKVFKLLHKVAASTILQAKRQTLENH